VRFDCIRHQESVRLQDSGQKSRRVAQHHNQESQGGDLVMSYESIYVIGGIITALSPLYYLHMRTRERLSKVETKLDLLLKIKGVDI